MKGNIYPTKYGYSVKYPGVYRRFQDKNEAEGFLSELRYREYHKVFDARDYRASKPLGFSNLVREWLNIRRKEEIKCFSNLENHTGYACDYFGNRNIKDIQYTELEGFRDALPKHLSSKTKFNIFITLHAFFVWIVKREKRDKRYIEMPEFPTIRYELRRRKTISREQQSHILDWLKAHAPFKVWLGIKWLITYISIRPGELIEIKEGDINRELGVIYVKDNKGRRIKTVPLLSDDKGSTETRALPHLFFFRHEKRKGVAPHQRHRFGKRCLYTWWTRACREFGIKHVDLYGGTRHSTVQWLRLQGRTPEEIKRATMHTTTKSFNRYFDMDLEDLREIYGGARGKVMEFKEAHERTTNNS